MAVRRRNGMKPMLIALALFLVACAEPAPSSQTNPPDPTATTAASATPVPPPGGEGVTVVVTGTPVLQVDGTVELCPPGVAGPCAGILLDGEIDGEFFDATDVPVVIEVTGTYDGRSIVPADEPAPADYPFFAEPEFASLCPGLEGTPSVNASETLIQALTEYTSGQADYAGMWWDQESSVMTVWFVGDDVSEHEAAIAALADGEPVCVAAGARFSEAELLAAMNGIQALVESGELVTPGFGLDTIRNQVPISLEAVDAATRETIAEQFGQRVVLYPFIEAADVSIADLPSPVPVVEGDVELHTNPSRFGGGMAALGVFEVRFDPDLNCIYFPGSEEGETGRTVPVWPFGYSATSSPLTVYDYDGNPIASEGDTIELGGGFVGTSFVEGDTCGADGAWIVSG